MSRREAGRAARDTGEDWEQVCAGHHDEALRLGILTHWVHNEPHGKIIHGKWEMVAAGVSDVTGVLHNRVGTTLATEMKSRKKRLYRHGETGISVEQQRHLNAVVAGGGLAFLLVRIVGEIDAAVPWQSVPWTIAKSAESVTAKELSPWRIPDGCRCYLELWCPERGVPVAGAAGGKRVYPRE